MDLVSSYFSDDEMENQANVKKAVKKNDDDRKSSDESDILDIVFVKNVSNAVKNQEKTVSNAEKSQIPPNDDIECICLDDSDSDNIEASASPEPSNANSTFPTIKKEISKKIDYLNLESSDTDDEQERIQNDVNNLLSSAAILNDIECGPTKIVPERDISTSLASCTDEAPLGKKRSSSPTASIVNIREGNEDNNSAIKLQNGEYIVPNDTAQCANDLIDWCQGMTYQGAGISMITVTISEPNGMVRYFCASDSDGTNCTKNRSPWIACSSDNQFSYKGKQITKDSSDNNDEDICKAADMAFNNLFIQNMAVDNTTLSEEVQKGMEMMFKQLAIVKEQMEGMTKWFNNLFRPGNPFDFDDPKNPSDTDSPPGKNQIEREQRR